jgi:hypothetical protein
MTMIVMMILIMIPPSSPFCLDIHTIHTYTLCA